MDLIALEFNEGNIKAVYASTWNAAYIELLARSNKATDRSALAESFHAGYLVALREVLFEARIAQLHY